MPMVGGRTRGAGGAEHGHRALGPLLASAGLTLSLASGFALSGDASGSVHPALPGSGTDHEARPSRLALLIGISDYLHFDPWGPPGRSDLSGPANDVERMRLTLRGFGFQGEGVRVLRDTAASRSAIRDAFRWLATNTRDSTDAVVIYFAGHGSRTRDLDGDETRVTPGDTLDEALVPWDASDPGDPEQLLLDDELGSLLDSLATRNVTIIVDACYSGTATRGGPGDPDRRPRGPVGGGDPGGGLDGLRRLDHTLLTAAAPGEVAYEELFEPEGRVYGVFSYHLTRALDAAPRTARYDEILRSVHREIRGLGHPQTPQLEGDRGARLFAVHGDMPARRFALLRPLGHHRYEGDVGAVHGVRRRALFDVYPPGETDFSGPPLAQLRVNTVEQLQFRGPLVDPGTSVPTASRAVLARVPVGSERITALRLFVHPSASAVRDTALGLPFVSSTDSASAHAWLVAGGGGYRVVVDGRPLPPGRTSTGDGAGSPSVPGTRSALCPLLSRALTLRTLESVRNPEPPTHLGLDFQMVAAGRPPESAPAAVDTVMVGRRYDVYARIEAPPRSVLYLSVAVTGRISEPTLVYPDPTLRNDPVPLNRWVRIAEGVAATEPVGTERLKAVASSDQFDLGGLVDGHRRRCHGARGLGRRKESTTAAVTGWTSSTRIVEVVPSSGGVPGPGR